MCTRCRNASWSLAFGCVLLATGVANAEDYEWQRRRSGNYGRFNQLDWRYQRGTRVRNPRAAVIGSLLHGIGQGLDAEDPKRNAVASHILRGLGEGFTVASQPTHWQQGQIRSVERGYYNDRRNSQYRTRPNPYGRTVYRPTYPFYVPRGRSW